MKKIVRVDSVFKNIKFGCDSDYFLKINSNWENIVGKKIYQYSLPYKINVNKDKTNIIIFCSNNIAFEIEHSKKNILNNINLLFGYEFINDIVIKNKDIDNLKGEV